MNLDQPSSYSRLPHRIAVVLACVTFPLIWVGGLVTTYDAGMAVPDWPSTYGYNLFLYPWQTWVSGPWDLFIEHGHRLLGALAGLITIVLVVAVWRRDSRRWMRYLVLAAFGLVIFQGVIGGMRVLFDERELAKLHGCTGPLFFTLTVAIAVLTSRKWYQPTRIINHAATGTVRRFSILTALLAYIQLVLGANLRHISVDASANSFRAVVFFHLLMAAVVTVHVFLLTMFVLIVDARHYSLVVPALGLSLLIGLQLLLGSATWIVNYSWPSGIPEPEMLNGFTIESKGWLQSNIVTAHVAVGSLIVATSIVIALRAWRVLLPVESENTDSMLLKGALA